MGLGAWLVVESQGGGRLLSRSPRIKYLGYTSSTFCYYEADGPCVCIYVKTWMDLRCSDVNII